MRTQMIHTTTTTTTAAKQVAIGQRSPWHSPVPYLFGGLAAMLGLIAFALLILACSFCRLPRHEPSDEENASGTESEGRKGDGAFSATKGSPVFEQEKIVVIMAGQDKPSFLATPANIIFPCNCNCPRHSDPFIPNLGFSESNTSTSTSTSSLPHDKPKH